MTSRDVTGQRVKEELVSSNCNFYLILPLIFVCVAGQRYVSVCLPESSSMISVHIVRDEEFSTPDHWVCDNQLPARVWRKKNTVGLNKYLHDIYC